MKKKDNSDLVDGLSLLLLLGVVGIGIYLVVDTARANAEWTAQIPKTTVPFGVRG